jgi:hypothetical protein
LDWGEAALDTGVVNEGIAVGVILLDPFQESDAILGFSGITDLLVEDHALKLFRNRLQGSFSTAGNEDLGRAMLEKLLDKGQANSSTAPVTRGTIWVMSMASNVMVLDWLADTTAASEYFWVLCFQRVSKFESEMCDGKTRTRSNSRKTSRIQERRRNPKIKRYFQEFTAIQMNRLLFIARANVVHLRLLMS